ncbi:hypothetical protein U0070_024305 [Myodes glareolus]|uniref:Uncharacterized protein n=1 Tax=Myodes glareolus TaxID=447135 RepID=A0AAW0I9G1_MYOGA
MCNLRIVSRTHKEVIEEITKTLRQETLENGSKRENKSSVSWAQYQARVTKWLTSGKMLAEVLTLWLTTIQLFNKSIEPKISSDPKAGQRKSLVNSLQNLLVRALSVAAGTQQPAARPVSLLSSHSTSSPIFPSSAPNPLRPPLKVSLAETPGCSGWSPDAAVEGDPRRGSFAGTCSAPNPPERRFSDLAGAGGGVRALEPNIFSLAPLKEDTDSAETGGRLEEDPGLRCTSSSLVLDFKDTKGHQQHLKLGGPSRGPEPESRLCSRKLCGDPEPLRGGNNSQHSEGSPGGKAYLYFQSYSWSREILWLIFSWHPEKGGGNL